VSGSGRRLAGVLATAFVLALTLAPAAGAQEGRERPAEEGAQALARYVTDLVVLTVRAGPSEDDEVIDRIASGERVTPLEEELGDYVRVRLADGVEGWVDGRYLVAEPIARDRLEALALEHERLSEAYETLLTTRSEAEASLVRLSDDYERLEQELERLRASTTEPSEWEARYAALEERLAAAEQEAESLRRRNKELEESADWTWFLAGAGVLAGGILLGFALPRGRRRRSSWDSL